MERRESNFDTAVLVESMVIRSKAFLKSEWNEIKECEEYDESNVVVEEWLYP